MITTPEPTSLGVETYLRRSELPRARLAKLSGVSISTLHRLKKPGMGANELILRKLADTLSDYVEESGDEIYAQLAAHYGSAETPKYGLRYYRQLAGMTQQELADAIGVSRTNINDFERYEIHSTNAVAALRTARVLAARLEGKLDHSVKDILYNIVEQMEARAEPTE